MLEQSLFLLYFFNLKGTELNVNIVQQKCV